MGAIRNVMLQFGMVQAMVAMNKATNERNGVALNQTHNCGKGVLFPIQQKIVCSGCQQEVPRNSITKAYQVSKGTYVEVTPAELDSVKVPTNGVIDIKEIVSPDALSDATLYTGQTYFLTPPAKEKFPPLAYAVILETLRGDIAIARTTMYNREYTCAIRVGQHGLIMDLIRYPSELRPEQSIALPAVDPNYIALAKQVKESMRAKQPKLDYPDHYNEAFAQMVAAKTAGQPLAIPAPAPVSIAADTLEQQLKAMLAASKANAPVAAETPAEPAVEAPKAKAKSKGKKGRAA